MKIGKTCYVWASIGFVSTLGGVCRQAETVFARWIDKDSIYVHNQFDDMSPRGMVAHLTSNYVERVNHKIAQDALLVAPFNNFLGMSHHAASTFRLTDPLTKTFSHLYKCLDDPAKIPGFLRFLRNRGLSNNAINEQEVAEDFNRVLEKYIAFMDILFSHDDEFVQQQHLLAVANRMFEFCFDPSTFAEFRHVIDQQQHYPLARLLYTTMWYNLASVGWKEWHRSCLKKLKREADAGKEIVYIAGGCDIYALIKEGIYNIRVIDPMLPTQPTYYIPDWFWFVQGEGKRHGIGDELVFNFPAKVIKMKRSYFRKLPEFFDATLCDNRVERIQKSETRWTLYDKKHKKIGSVIFERRFCTQQDFALAQNKAILMSFNELYYVTTCDDGSGWGIKPSAFAHNLGIYIKQLRNPVSTPMMCCMHDADDASFQFIRLGTCVN